MYELGQIDKKYHSTLKKKKMKLNLFEKHYHVILSYVYNT